MPIDLLNTLLSLLLPWLLGIVALGAVVVWLIGRQPPAARARPMTEAPVAPDPPRAADAPPPAPPAPPAPRAAPVQATPPPAATDARPLQADLLLVDDSAVVRAKLRRLFEPAGYRLALARDGEEALTLLRAGRYGLLITDLEMPRLDGVGLISAVQQQPDWAGMPILAITGHDDLQAQLNQLQAAAGIYRKPWVDEDLLGHAQALVQPSGVPHAPGEPA